MSESKLSDFQRLPKFAVPKHYNLTLKPNLIELTFGGIIDIHLKINEATDKIILNSVDLGIDEAYITSESKGDASEVKTPSKDVAFNIDQEIVTITFGKVLDVGEYKLSMVFHGELNDKMKGFYKSKYTVAGTEEIRYAAVTQFEATDARRCFPCFDEPAIKSTFDITLFVPKDRVALSNMPIVSCTDDESTGTECVKCVKFDRTPIMSTYLVAVVVGEYDYVEDHSDDGVCVRVYTPVGKKEQGRFALHVATKVLPFYKQYFQIAYPLPKIDLIAIADFSAGAMENWGLITYREQYLLVDNEQTALIRKQSIALTVGHEMAHQWFGNLVTMEWWTYLWLNEGYASFVEYLCVHHLFPEYNIWTQFVTDNYIHALELDSLKNSHPIEVPVSHPAQIDEIFDEISYNKGASVIRMLHDYIGDDDFRKGMNIYLTKYQYKNTITEDLWGALEEASNKPVAKIMSGWIQIMGFPVITVQSKQIDGNRRKLTITQEKFTADGQTNENNNEILWHVPITIATENNISHTSIILDTQSTEIVLENIKENDWIKLNSGGIGYYRTRYPSEMMNRLTPLIKDQSLPPLDRLGLLDDSFAMVHAGFDGTVEILKLIVAFRNETNFTVWSAITNSLKKLHTLLTYTDVLGAFDAYCIRLFKPLINNVLGWDSKPTDTHFDNLLRVLALSQLVTYSCPDALTEAVRRFKCHVDGECILPADLRSVCYRAAAKVGDLCTFKNLLQLYRATDLNEEKDRIARAMGCFKDMDILKKVIAFAIEGEVRTQDSIFIIASVSMNPIGRDMAWQFFKDNYTELNTKFPSALFARLVKVLTENFTSEERAIEVEMFFKEHIVPAAFRAIQQSIESIRLYQKWLNRDLVSIETYFKDTIV